MKCFWSVTTSPLWWRRALHPNITWLSIWYPTLDAWPWENFVSHIYSQLRGRGQWTPCRTTRGCPEEQRERTAAVGGQLYHNKRVRSPLAPAVVCDWLVWIIPWTEREVKPIRLRTSLSAATPFDRGTIRVESLSCWYIWQVKANLQIGLGALWGSKMSGQHLKFRPYNTPAEAKETKISL